MALRTDEHQSELGVDAKHGHKRDNSTSDGSVLVPIPKTVMQKGGVRVGMGSLSLGKAANSHTHTVITTALPTWVES